MSFVDTWPLYVEHLLPAGRHIRVQRKGRSTYDDIIIVDADGNDLAVPPSWRTLGALPPNQVARRWRCALPKEVFDFFVLNGIVHRNDPQDQTGEEVFRVQPDILSLLHSLLRGVEKKLWRSDSPAPRRGGDELLKAPPHTA
jgi:hypothetical protein